MVYDFHTHTFLSDGVLSPIELIRRAVAQGYKAIAITDHVGLANQENVLKILIEECRIASQEWDILALPGVEITHVPKTLIREAASRARDLGAKIVTVHGETIVEPVESGTNLAALNAPEVDILAHPGLLTENEANIAALNGVHLELSSRRGHSLTNGHVAKAARLSGANLLVDSDAHEPHDLLSAQMAENIAMGAGLSKEEITKTLRTNPIALINRLNIK
jgi:putative hydrolase